MSIFSAYIPMDRRLAIAENHTLPDRVNGSVLFADISGFTPLAETLARELGPQRGAEELTHQLNAIYGGLIQEVHRFGGSVIGFSGDAITCWFDGDNGRFATTCAVNMQTIMSRFDAIITADSIIELAVKIAVVAGPARRFLLGHTHIQRLDALAGELLDRTAVAGNLVGQREIILGKEVVDAFDAHADIAEWRQAPTGESFALLNHLRVQPSARPWPEASPPEDETTRSWLLPPVYERLQRGQGEFIAELRPAVALFLKFAGINYDADDEAGAKLGAFVEWTQTVLARYEGYMLQLTIGDKGSYMYVVFGAPTAHEDDPQRAVAAALALRDAPRHFPFLDTLQIGISQGQMRVGAYGSPTRRTYGAIGTVVNLAARLMDVATSGQILITERIAAAMEQSHRFEALPPLQLKGLAAPVRPFALLGKRQAAQADRLSTTSGRLVGRDREQTALMRALQALMQKQASGCVILEGAAGIGKTHLLANFVAEARQMGARCLVGAGDAIETSTPYHAWRPVFQQLLATDDEQDVPLHETLSQRLRQIDPDFERMLPLLNTVLPLELTDNELTAQMSGEVRADNTQEMLMRLLAQTAVATPLALIIEDANWLDSASWALLQLVHREARPLLLVVAGRPFTEPPPELMQLQGAPDTQHTVLDTLPPPAIEALVKQRLGVRRLPTAVARLIHAKAEGHPFFSEELAFALRDAGLLEIDGETCRLTTAVAELETLDFPDTIQGVIISRLDQLPSPQQVVLKVASVIGRIFAYVLLHDIHPIARDRPQLRDHLHTLEDLDITPMERPEPDLTYGFKHIIIQEVAYSLMTYSQRKQLHRATAEWLEQQPGDEAANVSLLAHHWLQAVGDQPDDEALVRRALVYLEKAGEQALRDYANREAVRFLGEAVRLDAAIHPIRDYPRTVAAVTAVHLRRARWHRQLATAMSETGAQQDAIAHLRESARLLSQPFPTSQAQFVTRTLREVARQMVRRLRRQSAHERAAAAQRDALMELAQTYGLRGNIYAVANNFPMALYMLLARFNRSEQAGPSPDLAAAYADMGNVAGAIPLHRLALQYVAMAEETAVIVAEDRTTAIVSARTAIHLITIGEWEKAEAGLQRALQLSAMLEDRRQWEEAASVLNALNFFRGALAEVVALGEQIGTSATYRGDALFELWSVVNQAQGYLRMGHFGEARTMADRALAIFTEADISDPGNRIITHAVLAIAHSYGDDLDAARQHCRQALDWLKLHPDPVTGRVTGAALTAEAHLVLLGHHGEQLPVTFQAAAAEACKMLSRRHKAYPLMRIPAALFQGVLAYLTGRGARARRLWQRCLTLTSQYPMRYEAGLAHYYLARYGGENGRLAEQQAHAEKAAALFAEIGAAHLQARAEAIQ